MKIDEMLVKLIKEKVQNEIEDIFSPENEKKLVKLINRKTT